MAGAKTSLAPEGPHNGELTAPSLGDPISPSALRGCSLFIDNTQAAIDAARSYFDDDATVAAKSNTAKRRPARPGFDGPVIAYKPRDRATQPEHMARCASAKARANEQPGLVKMREQQKGASA